MLHCVSAVLVARQTAMVVTLHLLSAMGGYGGKGRVCLEAVWQTSLRQDGELGRCFTAVIEAVINESKLAGAIEAG